MCSIQDLRGGAEIQVRGGNAERLKLLPESQAGFRKGRSTIDNIFVLNYIIQREKESEGRSSKVYALFIDLKAAFDNINREILWKDMRKKEYKGRVNSKNGERL